jgi:hypothetical protein
MGLPKTKLLMTSTLLACTSTGQPPTPHGILCSRHLFDQDGIALDRVERHPMADMEIARYASA